MPAQRSALGCGEKQLPACRGRYKLHLRSGRPFRATAELGLFPRALPWADIVWAFGPVAVGAKPWQHHPAPATVVWSNNSAKAGPNWDQDAKRSGRALEIGGSRAAPF